MKTSLPGEKRREEGPGQSSEAHPPGIGLCKEGQAREAKEEQPEVQSKASRVGLWEEAAAGVSAGWESQCGAGLRGHRG